MGWLFSKNGGAYQYARTATAPSLSGNFMYWSLWFYATSTSASHGLSLIYHTTGDYYSLTLNSSGYAQFNTTSSGNLYSVISTTQYTKDTWQCVWAAADKAGTTITISLNAGIPNANTTAKFPTGTPSFVQVSGNSVLFPSIDGYLAELSILNTDYANYITLANGATVLSTPGSVGCLGYWDMCGWGGDIIGGRNLTASSNGGAVGSQHPPMTRPMGNAETLISAGSPWYYYHGLGLL